MAINTFKKITFYCYQVVIITCALGFISTGYATIEKPVWMEHFVFTAKLLDQPSKRRVSVAQGTAQVIALLSDDDRHIKGVKKKLEGTLSYSKEGSSLIRGDEYSPP
ncbi:hypothetical protein, partial [Sansalvadorimonas verongulae]|uniref:hypothetical protein n=1 Tax=Sansalvadorimonas verongulae TaxID=2172824 RepID=UPI001E5B43EB